MLASSKVFKANLTGFECPDCAMKGFRSTSAVASTEFDSRRGEYGFRIYCKCDYHPISKIPTTPVFPTLEEALENWEDLWISQELKTLSY